MKKHAAILLFLMGAAFTPAVHAGVIFYLNNPAGFNTAASAFTFKGTENWEESTLAAGNIANFNDPLAPGVANGPFPTGTIAAAGVTAQSNTLGSAAATLSPRGVGGLATASVGYVGTPSDQVSPNSPNDSFDLIINPSGNYSGAVGLNPLFFDFGATSSTSTPGTVVVKVYDQTNALLGSQTVNGVDYSATAFLGMVTTGGSNIRRVNLWASTNTANSTAGADNIAVYGALPEPSSTMLMLGAGMAGLLQRRRRTVQT